MTTVTSPTRLLRIHFAVSQQNWYYRYATVFLDKTILSLCNHGFLEILSKFSKWRSNEMKDDMILILNQVERDLPGHFACDFCKVIHECDESGSFGMSGSPRERTPVRCHALRREIGSSVI